MRHPAAAIPRIPLHLDELRLFDELTTPVWLSDPRGRRLLWANDAALALWQADSIEILAARDLANGGGIARSWSPALLDEVRGGARIVQRWSFGQAGAAVIKDVHVRALPMEGGDTALMFEAVDLSHDEDRDSLLRKVEAFTHTAALVSLHRPDGASIARNPAVEHAFGPRAVDRYFDDLALQLGSSRTAEEARAVAGSGRIFSRRLKIETQNGPRWHDVKCLRLTDPADGGALYLLDAQDVTEARVAGERLETEKQLLDMASRGRPVADVAGALAIAVEAQCPGIRCSVLELRDGHLYGIAAPSLPAEYCAAIEGVAIGPSVGSCGTAAYRREPVIVEDIATDPLWRDFRAAALPHGLRACWSVPIVGADGAVLGSFAAYYGEPRAPTAAERKLLDIGTNVLAITMERDRALAEIGRGREQLRMILDALPMIISYVNQDQRYEFVNRAFERWFGTTREQALGKLSRDIIGAKLYEEIGPRLAQVQNGHEVRYERQSRDHEGREHFLDVHYLPHVDAQGHVLGHFGIVNDITARKQNEQMLEYLATHDQLTQLPNRSMLAEHLQVALARGVRGHHQTAVLFVDLDRFKNVNDTLGHDAGDRLLQAVAARFRQNVRAADTICRLGGDEFVVLMDDVHGVQEAATLAQKLIGVLTEPLRVDGHDLYVSASIGIAVAPDDGTDAQTLLKNADIAMYRAKQQGRNGFQFHSPEATAASFEHLMLETALRKALDRRELVLHYQPIIDLCSGRIEGVETLLRWRHPDLGLVAPGKFIPLAEDTGLIVPIGAWVLEEACRQLGSLDAPGADQLRVAVNLSPRQFRERDLAARIALVLQTTGFDPARLELEVTESSMMENPEAATHILRQLRSSGVRISVDDFGTGYSSLSFLKRFPIDSLKVDQSFVRDVVDDENDASIVRAIIAIGRSMRLSITAEGVETDEQLAFLRAERCDKAQGYHFGRPMDRDALEAWIRSRTAD
ncbi:MAG: EAL domain-containing protein [Betaproteobacteria bacterium]|nr:EAL domain-containing protein [Betaproteobacteria bacterium]